MSELNELVATDPILSKQFSAKAQSFKAFRCFYLAESYRAISKYPEAYALYGRCNQLVEAATQAQKLVTPSDQTEANKLSDLLKTNLATQCLVHAQETLDSIEKNQQLAQSMQDIKLDEKATPAKVASRTLLERMNKFDAGDASSHYRLVDFPPNFQAVPCRPQMFDLASSALSFPTLEGRVKPKPTEQKSFFSKFKLW